LNEIVTELTKPVWWVSVVFAGIAINLLSAYLKNTLDQVLTRASVSWRNRSVARQTIWLEQIRLLRTNEQARHLAIANEFRARLQSIHLFLFAIFLMLFHSVTTASFGELPQLFVLAVLAFSTVIFFLSFLSFREAAELNARLLRAGSKV
jgi:hypothetical protein